MLKSVLILPLADSNEFSLPLALDVKLFKLLVVVCIVPITVLFELVYVFKSIIILPLAVSNEFNLPFALEVNVFKLLVVDSNDVNLSFVLEVNVFNEDVEDSKLSNLPFCKLFVVSLDELYELKTTSSNLPVPTGTPFNVIEPVIVKEPLISVLLLTLNPFAFETEAVTLPSAI